MDIKALTKWFALHQRPLPWREESCSPWAVMVSEVMLQQTPVARVEPVWFEWMSRWPAPSDLAQASKAEVVIAWGRLGYPRRALRLHDAAVQMVANHKGEVPQGLDDLLNLPGIGDYTARAIRTFAFGFPEPVVDTNVRRVVARAHKGNGEAGPPRVRSDREELWGVLSTVDANTQVQGAKAIMELGATICAARSPRCEECPLAPACAWRAAGYPEYVGAKAPTQGRFEGSDRQVRGIILRELRHSDTPVPEDFLASLWPDRQQFQRALGSLVSDGLAIRESEGITLPR